MDSREMTRDENQTRCHGCRTIAPQADGEFALIRSGWRLTVDRDGSGQKTLDWWCPACFAKNRNLPPPSQVGGPRSR